MYVKLFSTPKETKLYKDRQKQEFFFPYGRYLWLVQKFNSK